jgi:predicted transcriptional regulator
MFQISPDDEPDAPVGTPATRQSIAIHWNWTTEMTREEIARALGVTSRTVTEYLSSGPNQEVKELMNDVESEVRLVAVAELKSQLQAAGEKARSAEKPVKMYADESGDIIVRDVYDDETGEVVKRYPVPRDFELLPDEEARHYARRESREILDQLVDITGAGEAETIEGDFTFNIEREVTDHVNDNDQ